MNALALYLGMSLGTVAGGQAYRLGGESSLALASAAFVALAMVAQGLSQRAAVRAVPAGTGHTGAV